MSHDYRDRKLIKSLRPEANRVVSGRIGTITYGAAAMCRRLISLCSKYSPPLMIERLKGVALYGLTLDVYALRR
jgi:hypothetical protein